MITINIRGIAFMALLLAGAAPAFAGHQPKIIGGPEIAAAPAVSAADAKATAEWTYGGKADSVVLDRHAGALAYRVDLTAGSNHREVLVDASSGEVTGGHHVGKPRGPGYRRV